MLGLYIALLIILCGVCYWVGIRIGYEEGYEDAIYDFPEDLL